MSVLTCEDIIKQGVRLAGVAYKPTDTKQLVWLKQWLRSVALGWPWPETESMEQVTLLAGAYNVIIGGASVEAANRHIHRVIFPVELSVGAGYLPHKITQQAFVNAQDFSPSTLPVGLPTKASYTRGSGGLNGSAIIAFNFIAKENYEIKITYQFDPAATYVLADIPWYQNDNTMIQAVAFKQSEDSNGVTSETTVELRDKLAGMLRDDKLKFGVIEQFTTKMNRSPSLT